MNIMTDTEKLSLILEKIEKLDEKTGGLEQRLEEKTDNLEQILERKIASINVHLENGTDKNIQLIAENFIELTKKLNQAIPVADKNLAYEVKVNYLVERVQILEKELAEIKSKIA
ncbi:MAG: hypothetical protein HFI37_03245 [Lachnospiraceae bacterium]|nr:hypothetical protein [Lachnospiraceae bacterium]